MRSITQPSFDPLNDRAPGCFGDCAGCGRRHDLPLGRAGSFALEVMGDFQSLGRLDYLATDEEADPRLSFAHLFPPGYGNMFGVMECVDPQGETVVLRAFSSLREGIRRIDGWVSPLLSVGVYEGTILPAQHEIKRLTSKLNGLEFDSSAYREIHDARRGVSQNLWAEMCAAYRFRNFRGEERSLAEAVTPGTPITGGMGECCAPKLLNHAVLHGLRPVSLAEFYWGEDRKDGRRVSGHFYPSCEARCQPLLGFMLCGLGDRR